MIGIREFKNFYKSLNIGESFYLNTMEIKKNVVDYVQILIQKKEIAPIKEIVERIFTQNYYDKIYNGKVVAPEMFYYKTKQEINKKEK